MTQPLICQHFVFDGVEKEEAEGMMLKLQNRDNSLDLYTTNHRAVIDVEKPIIFKRPATEGRFLSQKVWLISTAGTSSDSGSWTLMSFLATFPKEVKTSTAARSPASTAPSM